jgi:electron transfer flavoprotein-quinone oxidoreductase
MQAQGPIIKGMNHAVTAGALAADAFARAQDRGRPRMAGQDYANALEDQGVMDKLRPRRYDLTRTVAEDETVTSIVDGLATSVVGRAVVGFDPIEGLLERAYNSPLLVSMLPDTKTPYVTLPTVIAEELGTEVRERNDVEPPALDDRIGELTYDIDEGNPHIEVLDESIAASGAAVRACPVSAEGFGGGCYREERVKTNGGERRVVSLDTQPCVECGTCAIVADTDWTHPRGGKGVEYREG